MSFPLSGDGVAGDAGRRRASPADPTSSAGRRRAPDVFGYVISPFGGWSGRRRREEESVADRSNTERREEESVRCIRFRHSGPV